MDSIFLQSFVSVSMEVTLDFINVSFFLLLLTWCLKEILSWGRAEGEDVVMQHKFVRHDKYFMILIVLCNAILSILHLSFGFFEYRSVRSVSSKSIFLSMIWALASFVSLRSSLDRTQREQRRWPLVLTTWWVFSLIIELVFIVFAIMIHLTAIELPRLFPEPNFVDFGSMPLLVILLCFSFFPIVSCLSTHGELDDPLLEKNSKKESSNFAKAGIWSKLTFQWLNPVFKIGRYQKLELPHIPHIPQSETANEASLLLEKFLKTHKTGFASLTKVLFYALRNSLAVNAIFAGVYFFFCHFHRKFFASEVYNFSSFLLFFCRNNHSGLIHGSSPDHKLCELLGEKGQGFELPVWVNSRVHFILGDNS